MMNVRVLLSEDAEATRVLGESVLLIEVLVLPGTLMTADIMYAVDVWAFQAALAWDAVNVMTWWGPVQ